MVMSKLLRVSIVLLLTMSLPVMESLSAQVLPVLNSFSGRTFNGTVDVSWPVEFEDCSFFIDSVVIRHSCGAVFRNCRFESRSGKVYVAESGDGMILADCEVTGCSELRFSRLSSLSDRNYITGVMINGEEWSVLDEQEGIIDIDGLEIENTVRGKSQRPLFMIASAGNASLVGGNTVEVKVRGLEEDMFVGWQASDSTVKLDVDDVFICKVTAPTHVAESRTVVISAYTEYGLEAACVLDILPDTKVDCPDTARDKRNQRKLRKKR